MSDRPSPDPDSAVARGPLRVVLLVAGWVLVALAAIGVVVPLLPTTPLLLLAAACFARSSPRFHHWLLSTRLFGPLIREWEATGSIPLGAKIWALSLMAVFGGGSIVWFVRPWWAQAAMAITLLAVAVWIVRRPTSSRRKLPGPPRD